MDIVLLSFEWTDLIWIIIGFLFMIVGIAGCIIPVIPGPPLSFLGLLMLQLKSEPAFTLQLMIILAVVTTVLTIMDYVLPIWGAKSYGASKRGMWGSVVGLFVGLFVFPPFGFIIGTILGAFIGELSAGKNSMLAKKATWGVVIGFLFGSFFKLILSGFMLWLFITHLVC
jgi:uncharacterized protein YqgC (DUF456 family)